MTKARQEEEIEIDEEKSKLRPKSWAGCRNSTTILLVLILLNFY